MILHDVWVWGLAPLIFLQSISYSSQYPKFLRNMFKGKAISSEDTSSNFDYWLPEIPPTSQEEPIDLSSVSSRSIFLTRDQGQEVDSLSTYYKSLVELDLNAIGALDPQDPRKKFLHQLNQEGPGQTGTAIQLALKSLLGKETLEESEMRNFFEMFSYALSIPPENEAKPYRPISVFYGLHSLLIKFGVYQPAAHSAMEDVAKYWLDRWFPPGAIPQMMWGSEHVGELGFDAKNRQTLQNLARDDQSLTDALSIDTAISTNAIHEIITEFTRYHQSYKRVLAIAILEMSLPEEECDILPTQIEYARRFIHEIVSNDHLLPHEVKLASKAARYGQPHTDWNLQLVKLHMESQNDFYSKNMMQNFETTTRSKMDHWFESQ